jgi:Na+/H+ antiporter NhaA
MLRTLLQLLSWLALLGSILPPFLFLVGGIELEQCQVSMLTATIVWFIVTPLWMGRADPLDAGPEAAE